jgi:hypothetical protein
MFDELDKGGNLHFMVNVVKPQFNLHSEEANVSDIEDMCFFVLSILSLTIAQKS